MNAILSRWATPLTFGLFAVSAISGVALFLHVGQGVFHEMHEWLSIVLLAPFVLHMWRNWTPLVAYVRRKTLWAPLGLSLVAAAAFAAPALMEGGAGGSPMSAARLVLSAPLADVAPLFHTDAAGLRAALKAHGYPDDAANLQAAATAAHKNPFALIGELNPAR